MAGRQLGGDALLDDRLPDLGIGKRLARYRADRRQNKNSRE